MVSHSTDPRPVSLRQRVSTEHPQREEQFDRVVVEAPLGIRVNEQTVATTMRTPGHDEELAVGWLINNTVLSSPADVLTMARFTASQERDRGREQAVDTVELSLDPAIEPPVPRAYLTSSSCGICSTDVIEAAPKPAGTLHTGAWSLPLRQVLLLVDAMRDQQAMFELTGSIHAAALVDPDLQVVAVREDVGRHNAVDKVIGHRFLSGIFPMTDHVLVVSGRVSYEIVTKALSAGVAGIIAVSGPTTLAVDLARAHDLILIGFARDDRLNIYSGGEKVTS
jgi:FdhD protein